MKVSWWHSKGWSGVEGRLRRKWIFAGLAILGVVSSLLIFHMTRVPTREEQIAAALKDLSREITLLDKVRSATWDMMPEAIQNRTMMLPPVPPSETRRWACMELTRLEADSEEVMEGLKAALSDPSIEHDVLMVLSNLGSRARAALDRLLELSARPGQVYMAQYLQTLAAIAPDDERVVSLLISSLGSTNDAAWEAATVMKGCASIYDEQVQTRILREIEKNPRNETLAIPVLAAIKPGSERTCALMLSFLRDESQMVRAITIQILAQSGTQHREIIEELTLALDRSIRDSKNRIHLGPRLGPGTYGRNWTIERMLIGGLGRSGPAAQGAVPQLERILGDEFFDSLHMDCATALCRISGEDEAMRREFREAFESSDFDEKRIATASVFSIARETPEAIELLSQALSDENKRIRLQAVTMLGMLGEKAVPHLDSIEKLQSDPIESVRRAARDAAGRIRSPQSNQGELNGVRSAR